MYVILSVILGISTVVGGLVAIPPFREMLRERIVTSWFYLRKEINRAYNNMKNEDYVPSLIVCVGRGGAIVGSLLSGRFGEVPIYMNFRGYDYKDGDRLDYMMFPQMPIGDEFLRSVLIVDGEIHGGGTMKLYENAFEEMGARDIRTLAVYVEKGSSDLVHYPGPVINRDKTHEIWDDLPWKLEGYISPAKSKEEKDTLDRMKEAHARRSKRKTTVLLIRHCESEAVAGTEVFSGTSDHMLTALGKKQANALASILKHSRIDSILASPLSRASETANALANKCGTTVHHYDSLREIDYGSWEDVSRKELIENHSGEYCKWCDDPVENIPEGAEPPERALQRFCDFWDRRIDTPRHYDDTIAIVTHKTIIRLFLCHLKNTPIKKYREEECASGSITTISVRSDGHTIIESTNDTDHLNSLS